MRSMYNRMENVKNSRGGVHNVSPSEKTWELVNFCEFDKYAIKSYCAIHNVDENLNLGDITKVDETKLDDFNMMTWGFPCTDISIAGKQKGFLDENGEKTRSGMYYEGIRILREKKPAFSVIENVKALASKKFKSEFEMVLQDLDNAGYNSYWKVLNSKDYGVPQNRERVFIVSIRKDLDNGMFKFPEPFGLKLKLKDLLEDKVDEKFYVNNEKSKNLIQDLIKSGKLDKSVSNTIRTGGERKLRQTSMGYDQRITGLVSKQCSNFTKETEIANTLLARDYKGFGNQEMNGVIESV